MTEYLSLILNQAVCLREKSSYSQTIPFCSWSAQLLVGAALNLRGDIYLFHSREIGLRLSFGGYE